MKCPSCSDVTLTMTERQGVEIDYCPQCRGVWLDRGELDKLIEKAGSPSQDSRAVHERERYVDDRHGRHDRRDGYGDDRRRHEGSRRKSWLSDLFD